MLATLEAPTSTIQCQLVVANDLLELIERLPPT